MFKPVLTLATLLGLGTLTLAGAGATPSPEGFSCGVASERQQGLLRVEGRLTSSDELSGDYRFTLQSKSGGGSSSISQGGGFTAPAGKETTLGSVTLNADASYQLSFTVSANGKSYDCSGDLPRRL